MKATLLFRLLQFGILAYLTFSLGFFALLGLLDGWNELFVRSTYRGNEFHIESFANFLLGLGGLLGLVGLWWAAIYSAWPHKDWLRRLIYVCLLCGIASVSCLIYFGITVFDFGKLNDIGLLGFLVLPILWGCWLIATSINVRLRFLNGQGEA